MHFQELWDSCAQNKTPEISQNALPGILGLLCTEQDVENIKNARSGNLGLLCAEQDVGNLKRCTSRNSGTPVHRTRRRKSQNMDFQEFWTPVRRTRRRKPQKLHCLEFWYSCAQNRTSEISRIPLSGMLGLLCAMCRTKRRKFQKCTFRNSGTPVRRRTRRKSQQMPFQ